MDSEASRLIIYCLDWILFLVAKPARMVYIKIFYVLNTWILDLKEVNAALKASGSGSSKLTVPNLTKRRGSNH